jgi:hypothetical protein
MKEFLMIFRNEKPVDGSMPSAEQMQAIMQEWQNWIGGIAAQGKFVSTNRLYSEGKSIFADGSVVDGPYAEVKEMVGGYLIATADNLDAAVEMAKSCPNIKYGGKVEVRSVMSIDSDASSKTFLIEK